MTCMFAYSMREKTHAHRHYIDDVPGGIKQMRLTELIDAFRETTGRHYDAQIVTVQLVLVEGPNKRAPEMELIGKSDRGDRVLFLKEPRGHFFEVDGTQDHELGDHVEVHILKSTLVSLYGKARRFYNINVLSSCASET